MNITKKVIKNKRVKGKSWMTENGISQTEIKNHLKLKALSQVNETVQGQRDDRRVLQYLLDRGCPAGKLALPTDMRGGK